MTTKPLSVRTYESALRMHHADPRIRKPKLEDFSHLDLAPAVSPPQAAPEPTTTPVSDDAVRAALGRMQADLRVKFAEQDQ